MLRIDERSEAQSATLALSGSLTNEYIAELERAIGHVRAGKRVTLDLAQLQSVDRAGLAFLARAMAAAIRLQDCPPYIRLWIAQERRGVPIR